MINSFFLILKLFFDKNIYIEKKSNLLFLILLKNIPKLTNLTNECPFTNRANNMLKSKLTPNRYRRGRLTNRRRSFTGALSANTTGRRTTEVSVKGNYQ